MERKTYYHDQNIGLKEDKIKNEIIKLNKMFEETGKNYQYKLVKVETA